MTKRYPGVALALLALAACRSTSTHPEAPANEPAFAAPTAMAPGMDELLAWMTGTFRSDAQAAADPDNYFDIRLVMLPIWTSRTDGPWLYVEQAVATMPDEPYRQRVYRLESRGEGRMRSLVYALPDDGADLVGAWRNPELWTEIGPGALTLRDGCHIDLEWDESRAMWFGQTGVGTCKSTLRGAEYATSAVEIMAGGLATLDQGFDSEGVQVWGATEGPYLFARKGDGAP